MDPALAADRIKEITRWAQSRRDLIGLLLVGSYARGAAGPSSDIDLVLVLENLDPYVRDPSWASRLGRVKNQAWENWGLVQSLRAWYRDGAEVEFCLTTMQWIAPPLDDGTRKVLEGGYRILLDPHGAIRRALRGSGIPRTDTRRPQSGATPTK